MAQTHQPHSVATLRAITYRITSTPTKQLPPVAAQIAGSIWNCKDILSLPPDSTKASSEGANIAQRFRTTITSLLQDRTVEGRWSAVVLAKAAIEAGGLATLSKCTGWVKALIAILKKADPPTTRQLAIITLTRIVMLTWDHSSLVREITTPALPAFISACVANAERERCSAGELEAVLEGFAMLVPRHPTVFRSHETQVRGVLVKILSTTSASAQSGTSVSRNHQCSAARLLVLLHHCAPKPGSGEVWQNTWTSTINAAHQTCDIIFRSVVEEHTLTSDLRQNSMPHNVSGAAASNEPDALGLSSWQGIYAGSERLVVILDTLKAHLELPSTDTLPVRVGLLMSLIARTLSLTLELEADTSRHNHQIPKDEREALFCVLPNIHVAVLNLAFTLLQRFGSASMPFAQILVELLVRVFSTEKSDSSLRISVYSTTTLILDIIGPSLTKPEVAQLTSLISSCCDDLNPSTNPATEGSAAKDTQPHNTTAVTSSRPSQLPNLHSSASALLTTLITKINPSTMPQKSRTEVERTAILTRNKEAMVACVLNPMKSSAGKVEASLLPILAKEFPGALEVEAVLRPRMPPIVMGKEGVESGDGEEEEVRSEHEEIDDGYMAKALHFAAHAKLGALKPTNGSTPLNGEADELYSITPPRKELLHVEAPVESTLSISNLKTDLNGGKRTAPEERTAALLPAKRARISPERDTAVLTEVNLQPQAAAQQSRIDIGTSSTRVLRSEMQQQPPIPASTSQPAPSGNDDPGSGDDSDFEMPPLTMEPDTDPEDESEEDEE